MRKAIGVISLALALAAVAGAGLGDVLASWQTPQPGRGFNGVTYDGEYIWVKNTQACNGWVFRCTTTGSVVNEIALRHPKWYRSNGLTYDGEYLWTIYYSTDWPYFDEYRQYTTDGSYVSGFGFHINYGGQSWAVAWDGSYLWTNSTNHLDAEKVTRSGSVVGTVGMPVDIWSDAAYYRRQLWYSAAAGVVYGVTLKGSVVASFPAPGGWCEGTAFDGEFLWTLGGTSYPQYVYKVDIDVVGVAPASLGRVKALFR